MERRLGPIGPSWSAHEKFLGPFLYRNRQVVSEPMVVCGEGGEVFMVPTQRGKKKPK